MKYTDDTFLRLIEAVEAAGGRYLAEEAHESVDYHIPAIRFRDGEPEETGKKVKMTTSGCGEQALFVLPYSPRDGERGDHMFCAVCDNLGAVSRLLGD